MNSRWLRSLYYASWKENSLKRKHEQAISKIREKGNAQVVFLVANMPMWRYDGVMRLMLSDSRFSCSIISSPFQNHSKIESIRNNEEVSSYFHQIGVKCISVINKNGMEEALHVMNQADIIFYPQPYGNLYGNRLDNKHFRHKLLCYAPYGVCTFSTEWAFNTALHNQAWRIYSESTFHKEESHRLSINHGANVVVVGNPLADDILRPKGIDVWKPQPIRKKRLIWAPHFSIGNDGLQRNSFLWMADFMLELAQRYENNLQIAFKPHPWLLSMLYEHPAWGKERAKKYYSQWNNLPNGQYERGQYADLFATSDAMIHDCGSFSVEYLYTRHPVMFVSSDINTALNAVNEYGRQALKQHYIGTKKSDIEQFVKNVVLANNDTMSSNRDKYFQHYLLPPKGHTVAENIYYDITHSLFDV
jgi:hypothetical protein